MTNTEKLELKLTAEETVLLGCALLILKRTGAFDHSLLANAIGRELFERGKAIGDRLPRRAEMRVELLSAPDEVFSFTPVELVELINVVQENIMTLVRMGEPVVIKSCVKLTELDIRTTKEMMLNMKLVQA